MRKLLRKLLIWLGVSQPLVEDVDYRIRVLKGLGYGLVGSQQLVIFHHLLDGFTVTDNSPQVGYIAWSNLHIVYKGIDYTITDGNTNLKFAWWDYSVSTTTLQCQDTLPDTTDDDLIIFLNKNGIHATVPTTTCIDGSLIITESILAGALSANCVTSEKIYAGAVIAEKIATDAVVAAKIYAGAVTTDKLDAAAITTAKIADLAVTNAKIDTLSVSKLAAGDLSVVGTITSSGKFVTAASPNSRIEITQALIAGYSDATTKQFYLQASDGKAYFGGGAAILDTSGLTIKGQKLILQTSDGGYSGELYIDADGILRIDVWLTTKTKNVLPVTDNSQSLGALNLLWYSINGNLFSVKGEVKPTEAAVAKLGSSANYFLSTYTRDIYRTNEYSLQHHDDIALIKQMKTNPQNPNLIDKTTIPDILMIPPEQARQDEIAKTRIERNYKLSLVEQDYPQPCPKKTQAIKSINDACQKAINDINNISDDDLCNIDAFKEISLAFGAIRQLADKLDVLEKLVQK